MRLLALALVLGLTVSAHPTDKYSDASTDAATSTTDAVSTPAPHLRLNNHGTEDPSLVGDNSVEAARSWFSQGASL